MEVTPEFYSWLVSLDIFDVRESIKINDSNKMLILPESMIKQFLEGKYFKRIFSRLQEQYNKFYKIQANYVYRLESIVEAKSHSVKFKNWSIISDVSANFGIDLEEEQIYQLVNKDNPEVINDFLRRIYNLSFEMAHRMKENKKYKEKPTITDLTATTTKKGVVKQAKSDSVSVTSINPHRKLSETENILEFFLTSMCQFFFLKPRQAAALLSEKKKYLILLCKKGMKGDFTQVDAWFKELAVSVRHMNDLVKSSRSRESSKSMIFSICSTGLYSTKPEIAETSYNLISELQSILGTDWNWFIEEGIEAFLHCITEVNSMREGLLNLIGEMVRVRESGLDDVLKKINQKGSMERYGLYHGVVNVIKSINFLLQEELTYKIIDFCLAEDVNYSASVRLLITYWRILRPLEENLVRSILSYFKKALKSKKSQMKLYTLKNIFILVRELAKVEDKKAKVILKTILKVYGEDVEPSLKAAIRMEFRLIYKENPIISPGFFVPTFISGLTSNITFNDLNFIDFCLDYKLTSDKEQVHILDVLLSNTNIHVRKIVNTLVIRVIKDMTVNDKVAFRLAKVFKQCIQMFKVENNNSALELPLSILKLKIPSVNAAVEKEVLRANEVARSRAKDFNHSLLRLLWYLPSYDDFIIRNEEKYTKKPKITQNFSNPKDLVEKKKKEEKPTAKDILKQIVEKQREEVNKQNFIKKQMEERETKIKESLRLRKYKVALMKGFDGKETDLIQEEGALEREFKEFTVNNSLEAFLDLEQLDDIEQDAIVALTQRYSRDLRENYAKYSVNSKLISKGQVLLMLRNLGVSENLLATKEYNQMVKIHFGVRKESMALDDFPQILLLASTLAYNRAYPFNRIHENYKIILERMRIPHINKRVDRVIHMFNSNPDRAFVAIPPGFKAKRTEKVEVKYCLKETVRDVLGEAKAIGIELFDEILFDSIGIHIIEPYTEILPDYKLHLVGNAKNWPDNLYSRYMEFDKGEESTATEVVDLMASILSAVEEGRSTLEREPQFSPREKKEEKPQTPKPKTALATVEKNYDAFKNKLQKQKQEEDEQNRGKLQSMEENMRILNEFRLKKRKSLENRKKEIEEREKEKRGELLKKLKDKREKKLKEIENFLAGQRQKSNNTYKKLKDRYKSVYETPISVAKSVDCIEEMKKKEEFFKFDRKLNEKMDDFIEQGSIGEVLKKYEKHLKTIYNIYSQRGYDSINFYVRSSIRFEQFRDFAKHFAMLGIILTNDQLLYTFRRISQKIERDKEEKFHMGFKEFMRSFVYFAVYHGKKDSELQIEQEHLDAVTPEEMENIFSYLRLNFKFEKRAVEILINDRQATSIKDRDAFKRYYKKIQLKEKKEPDEMNIDYEQE